MEATMVHNYQPDMLRVKDSSNRRGEMAICTSCGYTWLRRYRRTNGTMCKRCSSAINGAKGIATIKAKPKVGKTCINCGKFSYYIRVSELCQKCGSPPKGEQHYNWKGGITTESRYQRTKFTKYTQRKVFARDNYTCQICEQYGGRLQVDHIKAWAEFPELRFDIDNCRTLCMACHYSITFNKELPEGVIWGHNLSRRIEK